MLQTKYGYESQQGVPGGLVDSSLRDIISRANGETSHTYIMPGLGIVQGSNPGDNIKLPTANSTPDLFEGVVMTGITEHDLDGDIRINPTKMLNILAWGKIWVRVPDNLTVSYGDKAFLIITGSDIGKFTNDQNAGIDISAKFIGSVNSGNIAPLMLFNAPRA